MSNYSSHSVVIEANDQGDKEYENDASHIQENYLVFRSFVGSEDIQKLLVEEAMHCHYQHTKNNTQDVIQLDSCSNGSLKLDLGIVCGGDLTKILPNAIAVAERAFKYASSIFANRKSTTKAKTLKVIASGPLSGLSLLYGINSSMSPHYDSPTIPGRREEWLCLMSFGNTMMFRCNDNIFAVDSGDVIVMDSMAVLHGVEQIVQDKSDPTLSLKLGLPLTQSRLGILFWRGRTVTSSKLQVLSNVEDSDFEGVDLLFNNENDDL
jgi:hypothetical protein